MRSPLALAAIIAQVAAGEAPRHLLYSTRRTGNQWQPWKQSWFGGQKSPHSYKRTKGHLYPGLTGKQIRREEIKSRRVEKVQA